MPVNRILPALLLAAAVTAGQQPTVGTAAPVIECKNHEGVATSFPPKGQWAVLAFYPKAATPG